MTSCNKYQQRRKDKRIIRAYSINIQQECGIDV